MPCTCIPCYYCKELIDRYEINEGWTVIQTRDGYYCNEECAQASKKEKDNVDGQD